jgi:hypothetical protein
VAFLAEPSCPAVVGGQVQVAPDGDCDGGCLTVINDRSEFDVEPELGWSQLKEFQHLTRFELPEVDRGLHSPAVGDVAQESDFGGGWSCDGEGDLEGVRDVVQASGGGEVNGNAGIEQDLAAKHLSSHRLG